MINAARRTSSVPGGTRPPSTKMLLISALRSGDDLLRHLLGVGELRARRQLHRQQRARGVLRGQKTLRQQRDAPDRGGEDANPISTVMK